LLVGKAEGKGFAVERSETFHEQSVDLSNEVRPSSLRSARLP